MFKQQKVSAKLQNGDWLFESCFRPISVFFFVAITPLKTNRRYDSCMAVGLVLFSSFSFNCFEHLFTNNEANPADDSSENPKPSFRKSIRVATGNANKISRFAVSLWSAYVPCRLLYDNVAYSSRSVMKA